MIPARCLIESTEGEEGKSELDISTSRASLIALMVSSRCVVAARRSKSALSRMVDNLLANWLIESIKRCCGWIAVWVSGGGSWLR